MAVTDIKGEGGGLQRLDTLDSLRGIAALVVVFSHFALVLPETVRDPVTGLAIGLQSLTNFAIYAAVKVNVAARASVILFFVLSGFVLARSLTGKHTPYVAYAIKRFFRIYPTLVVAVLVSYALHKIIGYSHPAPSNWLKTDVCDIDLSLKTLLKNLLLWGTNGSIVLDGAIWSLVHELRISFIFPVVLWTVRRFKSVALAGWLIVSIICTTYMHMQWGHFVEGYREPNFWLTWFDTAYFIVFFALGAFLALNSEMISAKLGELPKWLLMLLAAGSVYCLLKSYSSGFSQGTTDYLKGIGGFGIIAFSLSFRWLRQALGMRVPVWIGRISYSLYLIHMPILYAVVEAPNTPPPLPVIVVAVLVIALIAAEIMARTIEYPTSALGKFLARRWLKAENGHVQPNSV